MLRHLRGRRKAVYGVVLTTILLASTLFALIQFRSGQASVHLNDSREHHLSVLTSLKQTTFGPADLVTPTTTPTGSGNLQLFVEPAAGEQVILDAINNAHQSVWLEMYLLTDKTIIQALEDAAGRHVDVRVMLEPNPFGSGSPQATIDALKAAGVSTEFTNPSFKITHEKGMIIDEGTAFIMTSNFTYSALNGKNREYGVIDTVPQDVKGVIDIFNADWNRSTVQLSDENLVVSPVNARNDLTTLINGAQKSLIIEAEELYDPNIAQAIAADAQRGVQVQVILPKPQKQPDPNSNGIATIKAGGAQVEEDPQLIMHAKMLVVDGKQAFVGSENFSTTSLDSNRELGLLLSDPQIISTLQQTFNQDWSVSESQTSTGYDY
jgi:phosphatidylserine/phosphatidylglycerophosphate/cardiolipin synthase-like enzyme